ncbi:hypothetical protein B0H14DRAFT_2651611 [Mycena olivaceomarginata]|nr:hypothetical protein B0H14DRAFT_2651611 [Mycena olivaceomarginata]
MTRQRPCPPARKRTRRRTKAEIRELGRMWPSTQTRATKGPASGAKRRQCRALSRRGRGLRVLHGSPPEKAIQELHPKELPRQMIVKWGLEYHACEVGQTQVWFCAFKVERRLLAERIIRLRLLDEGYALVKFEEPCPCTRRHREYHYMHPGGSLEEIERLAVESFEEMGEQNIACQILRPRRRCAKYAVGLLKFGRS